MQELTLMLIRFAYLAILWIFVLGAISVIRSDMFGARVAREGGRGKERRAAKSAAKARSKPAKLRRGECFDVEADATLELGEVSQRREIRAHPADRDGAAGHVADLESGLAFELGDLRSHDVAAVLQHARNRRVEPAPDSSLLSREIDELDGRHRGRSGHAISSKLLTSLSPPSGSIA